ncbi:MAG TPA: 5-formyltetrahydrofolate cyclo-ligase [Clostridiaceae bacterium]|nr:5-formyltetrahydrofolate cyclo-ligase [Clostridiaceae bacterium]
MYEINKQELRIKLLERRIQLTEEQRTEQSSEIIKHLLNSDYYKNANLIFTFYSMPEEVNTEALIKCALSDGKRVAVPVTFAAGRMEAFQIFSDTKLYQDKLGIRSPDPELSEPVDPEDIDLTVVPLLGYNLHGYRIGYGSGYYDRFLPRLSAKCTKVGIAFDNQKIDSLPAGVDDYPLDEVLTPQGFVKLQSRIETHCHSAEFSIDCGRSLAELVNEAEKKNFKVLTLTDHYDKDIIKGRAYPGKTKVGSNPQKDEWIFNLDQYVDFVQAEQVKLKERNSCTELLLGIELGYQDYLAEDYKKVIPNYPFDLIIGSIHIMYLDDFAINGNALYGQGKQKAYDDYLKALIEMVESGLDFDVLGHFDYVIRYSGYADPKMYYQDHAELFDHLFKAIITRGISLEVNTRTRYRQIRSREQDWGMTDLAIFARYYELGGRMITPATDAHAEEELFCLISETIRRLKQIGFTQGTYFKARQPIYYDLL